MSVSRWALLLGCGLCLMPFGAGPVEKHGRDARATGVVEKHGPDARGTGFWGEGNEFRFDTGLLKGTLRGKGRSIGLGPVVAGETPIAGAYGLFSHYRLLDDQARYGKAAWDWKSEAKLLEDGAVEVRWLADAEHPFDMTAVYRFSAADTLDVTTTVTAAKDLKRLEVFLASYLSGFGVSKVYAKVDGKAGFIEAVPANGVWQMFPRDAAGSAIIQDGRWKRPPSPVEWKIMPEMAAPLALRRDAKTGLTAVFMARPEDCFAIATPHGEESHRSMYLSLFGTDLGKGKSVSARTRLVIGKEIADEEAVRLYERWRRNP